MGPPAFFLWGNGSEGRHSPFVVESLSPLLEPNSGSEIPCSVMSKLEFSPQTVCRRPLFSSARLLKSDLTHSNFCLYELLLPPPGAVSSRASGVFFFPSVPVYTQTHSIQPAFPFQIVSLFLASHIAVSVLQVRELRQVLWFRGLPKPLISLLQDASHPAHARRRPNTLFVERHGALFRALALLDIGPPFSLPCFYVVLSVKSWSSQSEPPF